MRHTSAAAAAPGRAMEAARFREPLWRLRLARSALLWEQLWPALWPPLFVAGLFALLALFDLLPLLPGLAHGFVLGGFAGAFLYLLYRGISHMKSPDAVAARRRIERETGLSHRPLTALRDQLAGGGVDAESIALWQIHQRRLQASLKRLRVGWPRAGLAGIDPFGLRAALVLLLIVAGVASWGDGFNRVARAVTPDFRGFNAAATTHLDIWITPPSYTGIAPSFVDTAAQPPAVLSVPEGSTVLAQVQGGSRAPQLYLGEARVDFGPIGEETYRASAEALTGDSLRIEQDGRVLGEWSMQIIPDKPPTIALAKPPAATDRGALRLEYQAGDDYGLDSVQAFIRRPASDGKEQAGGTPIELNLPLPGIDLKTARAASYHDLTPHPWAGLPVELRLIAKDARGQSGMTEPLAFTLPEREFHHPVARAIIEQRKHLTLAPGDRVPVTRVLGAIAKQTDRYNNDVVVLLALRVAQRRLIDDWSEKALAEVQALLWDTAVRIEDGDLGAAERDLRLAQEKLRDALANNASDEEIEKLMDELQQAMNRYLDALAEKMQRDLANGAQPKPMQRNGEQQMINREDLQRMLDQAREMARDGARQAAQDMLAQLQEMLENLQAMGEMQQPGDNQAMQMMQDLEQLTQRQQQLLEQSFRQSQQMQSGQGQQGEPMPGMEQQAGQQEALRRGLGDLMRQFGEMTGDIPRPMGRAERAMRDAVDSLQQGDPNGAAEAQARALDQLQQAGQAMSQALAEQLGDQPGMGPPQDRYGQSRDPLGRSQPGMGMIDTGDVAIPDKSDLQRAREILDELRRRAGERTRPKPEREYIDRLLRRF